MTYETLLHDLNQAYMYFLTAFSRFLNVIKQHPLIMLSLFIVVSLPVLTYIFIFISTASDTADDMTTEGFRIYKYFMFRKKELDKRAKIEAFNREKINRQMRAYELAQEFFKNNPNRMSISIMGFKFFQDDFEKKNWSNSKRTRITKSYRISENGELSHSKTSISSTESFDNTSDLQLENNFDAD